MSSAFAPLSAGQGAPGRTLLGGRLPQDPGGLCCLSGDVGRARATLAQASNDKSKNVKDAAVATSKARHGFPFSLNGACQSRDECRCRRLSHASGHHGDGLSFCCGAPAALLP